MIGKSKSNVYRNENNGFIQAIACCVVGAANWHRLQHLAHTEKGNINT